MTHLIGPKTLKAFAKQLAAAGVETDLDIEAGTFDSKDGDKCPLKAIQKGRGGPWIATVNDTERVAWGHNAPRT